MLLFERKVDDHTTLAVWKMEESEEQLLSLFSRLRNIYEEKIATMTNSHRRLEYLSVRALLLHLLGKEPNIVYDKNGKPSLPEDDLNISISHTNLYVAVIVNDNKEVGVDIEMKKDKIFRVRHKFVSTKEKIDPNCELESLLIHWCAKEAVYKMATVSLPEFSEDILLDPFVVNGEVGDIIAYDTKQMQVYKLRYEIHDDFVLVYSL